MTDTIIIDGVEYNMYIDSGKESSSTHGRSKLEETMTTLGIDFRIAGYFNLLMIPVGEQSLLFELKFDNMVRI